jgi:hypothetical protein
LSIKGCEWHDIRLTTVFGPVLFDLFYISHAQHAHPDAQKYEKEYNESEHSTPSLSI